MTLALVFSTWQLVLLLLILLILFGSKLPRIARSLGEGITEFKKGLNKGTSDDEEPGKLPDVEERRRQEAAKRTGVDEPRP